MKSQRRRRSMEPGRGGSSSAVERRSDAVKRGQDNFRFMAGTLSAASDKSGLIWGARGGRSISSGGQGGATNYRKIER